MHFQIKYSCETENTEKNVQFVIHTNRNSKMSMKGHWEEIFLRNKIFWDLHTTLEAIESGIMTQKRHTRTILTCEKWQYNIFIFYARLILCSSFSTFRFVYCAIQFSNTKIPFDSFDCEDGGNCNWITSKTIQFQSDNKREIIIKLGSWKR